MRIFLCIVLLFTAPAFLSAQEAYDSYGNLIVPGTIVSERVVTGSNGLTRTINGNYFYQDGAGGSEVVRSSPWGTTVINNDYLRTDNGFVTEGTRTGPGGNTITSNGTIVIENGAVNRDVVWTGPNGGSSTYSGKTVKTDNGTIRTGTRTNPDGTNSSFQSDIVSNGRGFDRTTNRVLANGQTVLGTGSVTYDSGRIVGYRSAQSSTGRGFVGQSTNYVSPGSFNRVSNYRTNSGNYRQRTSSGSFQRGGYARGGRRGR